MAAKKRGGKKRAADKNQNEAKTKKTDDVAEESNEEVKNTKIDEADDIDEKSEERKVEKAESATDDEEKNSKEKPSSPPVKRALRSNKAGQNSNANDTQKKVVKGKKTRSKSNKRGATVAAEF